MGIPQHLDALARPFGRAFTTRQPGSFLLSLKPPEYFECRAGGGGDRAGELRCGRKPKVRPPKLTRTLREVRPFKAVFPLSGHGPAGSSPDGRKRRSCSPVLTLRRLPAVIHASTTNPASPAPRRSRCSGGFIHGLLGGENGRLPEGAGGLGSGHAGCPRRRARAASRRSRRTARGPELHLLLERARRCARAALFAVRQQPEPGRGGEEAGGARGHRGLAGRCKRDGGHGASRSRPHPRRGPRRGLEAPVRRHQHVPRR